MIKVSVYVPESHIESVKAAMFNAGGGKFGNYDSCSWQALGLGQFRPLESSTPFSGALNSISTITEYCLEMICDDASLPEVVAALKRSHPYEIPAYSAIKLLDV
jgi:hypothetical protein